MCLTFRVKPIDFTKSMWVIHILFEVSDIFINLFYFLGTIKDAILADTYFIHLYIINTYY